MPDAFERRHTLGGLDVNCQASEQGSLVALIHLPEELIQASGNSSLRNSSKSEQGTRGGPPFLETDKRNGPCSETS